MTDRDTPSAKREPSELVKRIRAYSYVDAQSVEQLERELAAPGAAETFYKERCLDLERKLAERSSTRERGGAWFVLQDVGTTQQRLCSNGFESDAQMLLTGDFKDVNESFAFACAIAEKLNASATPPTTGERTRCTRGNRCEKEAKGGSECQDGECANRATASTLALTVPEGWMLVPKQWTSEMAHAGFEQADRMNELNCAECGVIYQAMIAKAPQPPSEFASAIAPQGEKSG